MLTPEMHEHYVNLIEFAAAATSYVSDPAHWPGYVAWTEQICPGLPRESGGELARVLHADDALKLMDMASSARDAFERGKGA